MGGPQKESKHNLTSTPSVPIILSSLSKREGSFERMQDQVGREFSASEGRIVQPDGGGRAKTQATEQPNACKLLTAVPGTVNTTVFVIIIITKTYALSKTDLLTAKLKKRSESEYDLDFQDFQEPERVFSFQTKSPKHLHLF